MILGATVGIEPEATVLTTSPPGPGGYNFVNVLANKNSQPLKCRVYEYESA
jgi:hypothetical protein